mgnify:CR=1 FL=1
MLMVRDKLQVTEPQDSRGGGGGKSSTSSNGGGDQQQTSQQQTSQQQTTQQQNNFITGIERQVASKVSVWRFRRFLSYWPT